MTDYIIVGGGPTGMTIAYELTKKNPRPKITIIEPAATLGGIHRVNRVGGAFSEHGPRVYSTSFVNFRRLLREMSHQYNTNPDKIFTKYKSQVLDDGLRIAKMLSSRELLCLVNSFALFAIGADYTHTSVFDYMTRLHFNPKVIEVVDSALLATDGAGVTNYSMNKFFQLINQESMYNLLQPIQPNDTGFIGEWQRALEDRGVSIIRETVTEIECGDTVTKINGKSVSDSNVILAIPPQSIQKIRFYGVSNVTNVPNVLTTPTLNIPIDPFGMVARSEWVRENSYSDYICVAFSWHAKISFDKTINRSIVTPHGLLVIPLSEYFSNVNIADNAPSEVNNDTTANTTFKTIVSTGMSRPGRLMESVGRDNDLIIRTAWLELQHIYSKHGIIPMYDFAAVGSDTNTQPAYIRGVKFPDVMPMESNVRGLYTVGPHTNAFGYAFTSIESAVESGLVFMKSRVESQFTVVMLLLIIVIVAAMIWHFTYVSEISTTNNMNSNIPV